MPCRQDAFVQAYRRRELRLQFRVIDDIVVVQRLLDQEQTELIEFAQPWGVVEPIHGIAVRLQHQLRVVPANQCEVLDIVARLDLDLDAPITFGEITVDGVQQLRRALVHADRDAHRNAISAAAEHLLQR